MWSSALDWLSGNWPDVAIPLAVFLSGTIAAFWLRGFAYASWRRWAKRTRWQGDDTLVEATKSPSALWALVISASLALAVSGIPARWKDLGGNALWTLFVISIALCAINLSSRLIRLYGERVKAPGQVLVVSRNVARTVIIVVAVLTSLEVWGVPTTAVLLLIGVVALAAALAFRDYFPSVLAWFQLSTTQQVKVGDYIKLETGEEGYVADIGWRNTQVTASNESAVLVPTRKLVQSTVVNYGRPLKKAKAPFRFYARAHLKELTGLRATDLRELTDTLKTVPDSVVYYHTHHFLEEHHYLTPEPANDYAIWVSDVLGEEALGERLAAVDTFEFATLGALRDRLVGIMEEHLSRGSDLRQAAEGREFHFIKSVSVVLPTPYLAHDLREFLEALRKLGPSSLYFHMFEARLRLKRATNDFSAWLTDSLEEKDLAQAIARFDAYTYTLEGLRSSLIQLIEKRIR